jgi:hypothetical protein
MKFTITFKIEALDDRTYTIRISSQNSSQARDKFNKNYFRKYQIYPYILSVKNQDEN